MGGKYEVAAWGMHWGTDDYSYMTLYMGESLIDAGRTFWRNRGKYGCLTFHYRRS